MAEVKLTKNELRVQQNALNQLEKYLPTLQLKKAMLQSVVGEARAEIVKYEIDFKSVREQIAEYSGLLSETMAIDVRQGAKIKAIHRQFENIAGVEVPSLDNVEFDPFYYNLFDTPAWVDSAIAGLRHLAEAQVRVQVAREKLEALEKELREVSIRVNLFEKILIPRAIANIKKIKVFLGDQQLAAVSQAKVAKSKIEKNKLALEEIYAL